MRFVAGLLALTLAAGCGSDGPTANQSVEGTWTLLTVNAAPLPFNVGTLPDGSKLEITGQTLALIGGKYTATTAFRSTSAAGQAVNGSDGDNGTYAQSGATVTFTSALDNSIATATLSGNRLTASDGGVTLIFGKT
jgi:hypothetical protein